VSAGSTRIGLRLRAAGYGSSLSTLGDVAPRLRDNRVLYAHGALSEWYANGPLGVEQGFTLARALPGHATGPLTGLLTLAMALSGNTHAALSAGGQSVTLSRAGETVLRYGDLSATDAGGHVLHSWLALRGGRLLLRVDTKGARYPLRIDPLLQEAELTASDGEKGDTFGVAVAVSGNTIVVGARQYNGGKYEKPGKAYVFVRPASGWANATQTAELKATDGEAARAHPDGQNEAALFGQAVAIDGDTIVVGAPEWEEPNPNKYFVPGAAYVFVKPAGGWSGNLTQTAELHPADGSNIGGFGIGVAVSAHTVFVGSQSSEELTGAGAVYVYEMPGGGWSGTPAQTAKLTTLKATGVDTTIDSIAASGDTVVGGGQVVISPDHWESYVWVRPAGGWKNAIATVRLAPPVEGEKDRFGAAIAISGGTVVVGAPSQEAGGNPGQGAAFVFQEPSGGWVSDPSPNAELTESDGIGGFSTDFGVSVAIAGKTIVVGDPTHYSHTLDAAVGSADVFEEPTNGWASETQDSELIPSLEPGAEIGYAVAATDEEGGVEVEPTVVGGSSGTKVGSNFEQGEAFVFGNPLSKPPAETPPSEPSPGKTFSGPSNGSTSPPTASGSGASPSPSAPNPQTSVPDAQLVSTSLTASSSGTVTVKLTCPAGESSCIGSLTLTAPSAGTATHHSKKKKAAVLTLAAGSFTIPGGQLVTLQLHLSAKARALLAKSHLLHAQAKILAHDLAGAIHTTLSTVTIRLVKAKHGHKGKAARATAKAARATAAVHYACSTPNSAKLACHFSTPSGNIRCLWTPKPNNVACVLLASKRAYRLRPTGKAKAIKLRLARRGQTLPTSQQIVFPQSLSCHDTKTTMTCNQDFGLGEFKLAPDGSRGQ
jgi:FG-GAP repeat